MKKISAIDAILFDIDGVLVDVRQSYLEAIRQTVQDYFEKVIRYTPISSRLLSISEVEAFKRLGGLNNDWDCTFAIIIYLMRLDPITRSLAVLKRKKKILSLKQSKETEKLVHRVYEAKNAKETWYETAKSLFQEHYLGHTLYKKAYGKPPQFYLGRGLIEKEKLIISRSMLNYFKQRGIKLGIVTGRNRFEANFVLRRFRIQNYFQSVVTADDVFREELQIFKRTGKAVFLGKPHPFSVLKAASQLARRSFLYVGDLPDDVKAAHACRSIKILSAGLTCTSAQPAQLKKEFRRARAHFILDRPNQLKCLVQ
jgi:HAD superfamily hydrolase (TIGR01548 family)